jgi:two-component sensor histidine kinase
METCDHHRDKCSATSTEKGVVPFGLAAAPSALDAEAFVSVITNISHLVADSLEPVGWGLAIASGASASNSLLRALIRIDAVTSLYRRLSNPPCPVEPIEDYCRALCCEVVLAFGRLEIRPCLAMCDVPLSCGHSFLIAILVIELMTNALKHGAAPRQGGVVWVAMTRLRDGRLELSVTDNFAPPKILDPPRPRLIEALTHALSGELIIGVRPSYTTRIRFPLGGSGRSVMRIAYSPSATPKSTISPRRGDIRPKQRVQPLKDVT